MKILLPNNGLVEVDSFIVKGGHFTWNEATKGGTRIPRSEVIVERIIAIAEAMEEVRERLGNRAITVNSWYRTPEVNSRIGGASNSRHMIGDAIDFTVEDCHPFDVHAKLDDWWGERGGLGKYNSFTHIDLRGSCARWDG
jgi:Peptidase M15